MNAAQLYSVPEINPRAFSFRIGVWWFGVVTVFKDWRGISFRLDNWLESHNLNSLKAPYRSEMLNRSHKRWIDAVSKPFHWHLVEIGQFQDRARHRLQMGNNYLSDFRFWNLGAKIISKWAKIILKNQKLKIWVKNYSKKSNPPKISEKRQKINIYVKNTYFWARLRRKIFRKWSKIISKKSKIIGKRVKNYLSDFRIWNFGSKIIFRHGQ